MPLTLTFLGSGTSAGVPMIGCDCDVCRSDDPRDRRTRPSAAVAWPDDDAPGGERRVLIDTTPEMRQQVIREHIERIDGVLYTHTHADHVFGLDDLRRFNAVMGEPVHLYAEAPAIESLTRMFRYVFKPGGNPNGSFIPSLIANEITAGEPIELFGATWTPLRLLHGRLPVLGFRVEHRGAALAYCTDVSRIPPESFPLLADLDLLVIDALRYRHHPTHLTVDQALELIDRIGPAEARLTHIAHDISHADLDARLPDGVALAHDGMAVTLDGRSPGERRPNG